MMKKLILLIIVVIPLLNFGQAKKVLRKALRTTDLNERIKLLNQVIDEEPKNLDAYFYRATAKNDLGDYSGAIVDYSKIIIVEPDADTYYNRGNSKYSLKDFTGAKVDYAKAYMLDENFIDALYSLACVKLDLGEFDRAIDDFTTIIKQVPDNPNIYALRAIAYKAVEKNTAAVEDYSMAIALDPSADNYYNRGAFLMDIKYFEEAQSDLTRSLRLNRNNAFGYFYRGASNLFLGAFDNSISDFTKAISFDTMDFDAYLGLAMAYLKNNDLANAKKAYDRANAILSLNNVNNIEQYANTYWFQNQYYYFNNVIIELAKLK
ncbi:tetratricopeptide repeat protein [Algibacter amylolyticus]|nr:tetratricopeptide repeat protein [Algibacter amylolyticus]MBB5269748.1 tetratricopeptide (TPR) repeat protein [Algibacter amylolyticus]